MFNTSESTQRYGSLIFTREYSNAGAGSGEKSISGTKTQMTTYRRNMRESARGSIEASPMLNTRKYTTDTNEQLSTGTGSVKKSISRKKV